MGKLRKETRWVPDPEVGPSPQGGLQPLYMQGPLLNWELLSATSVLAASPEGPGVPVPTSTVASAHLDLAPSQHGQGATMLSSGHSSGHGGWEWAVSKWCVVLEGCVGTKGVQEWYVG